MFVNVLLVMCLLVGETAHGKTMWDTVKAIPSLRWMARVLESRGLASLFDAENVTVYLPTSDGFFLFDSAYFGIGENDVEKWEELLTYGSQNGKVTLAMLPSKGRVTSRLHPTLSLYVNRFSTSDGLIITINGATILQPDIVTDNGILHIVDRIIAPVGSHMTIAEYLENPQVRGLSFSAIIMAAIVVPTLTQKTNSTKSLYTSFSPNDSYLYPMPEYGKEPLFNNFTILREVYQAHIIEDEALYLPAGIKGIPTRKALYGSIRFYTRDGKLYIANNRVHAKVIQANIPTVNGVIHVIDNLLHYVYHNALQVADSMPDTKIFAQLMNGLNSEVKRRLSGGRITLFIPTDWAFSKVPLYWQAEMLRRENMIDQSPLEKVLFGHVIEDNAVDSSRFYEGLRLNMANNQSLTIVAKDGDFYLETADKKMTMKIDVLDIGVTNGVVHLVSNILFAGGFTIWEALSDIPQLKRFYDKVTKHFPNMRTTLNLSSETSMTAFIPSNEVFDRAAEYINSILNLDPQILNKAFQGHVMTGRYPSSRIEGEKVYMTLSGQVVRISRRDRTSTITISGGHVTSEVKVRDIFCSNGVLHIIDDLLHTPTRTIDREIRLRDDLRYMQALFEKVSDNLYNLNSKSNNYTIFVANNDAFSSLPWDTVNKLLYWENWTKQILRAHIVMNESRTLDQMPSGTALTAGYNVIYVLKKDGQVYVVNNNMMAQVVVADIPAVNGWIHIVDRILTVPYVTVADIMGSREEVSLFHQIMSPLAEYKQLITSPLRNVTLFVPSSRYIKTLTAPQLTRIKSDPEILRKIFYGHVLPNVRLDDVFLRQYPEADYCSRSSYNISFKISKGDGGMYVDVGYDDIQPLDLIARATGCADGVVYVIDGFLNYSPFTVLERLKREPRLSVAFKLMTTLAPQAQIELLNNPDMTFTFLMPDDLALDYLSFNAKSKLESLPDDEKQNTFWRHIMNGTGVYYDDFKVGHLSDKLFPPEVSFSIQNDAVYVHYKSIKSKMKQWNLIASNGVIHILMQFLYDSNGSGEVTTTTTSLMVIYNPVTGQVGSLEGGASSTCLSYLAVFSQIIFLLLVQLR